MTNGDMQPHTFEADMYLEKLDQDQEKVRVDELLLQSFEQMNNYAFYTEIGKIR